jgi:allantoinase
MLVRGGSVVLPGRVQVADVRVRDGRIVEIGSGLTAAAESIVDAGGLTVLPGAIDPHGHQWEPGFTSHADFRDVTASAAFGGVTTLLDHPLTPPVVLDLRAFAAKVALGERTSSIDFGLHGGASPGTLDELEGMWRAGATGIKLFTCPTGTQLDGFEDPDALARAFDRLGSIGALALVHAEDAATLGRTAATVHAEGGGQVADFARWHSLEAEATATDRVLDLAERSGAPVYIVHASDPSVVDQVAAARDRGLAAHVETCPHYLHLWSADLAAQGARAMTAPPVRDEIAREGLRQRLGNGMIDTVGSDHCTVGSAGKSGDTMESVIPGLPSLDLFVPLLLDLVATGVLDLPRLAEVTAATPARVFGLPAKGAIEIGRDADLVLVDPTGSIVVDASRLPSSAGWSPYDGRTLRGSVVETLSRGEPVARDGQPIERAGHGRFVRRMEVDGG